MIITTEEAAHGAAIETLLDTAFGPGRHAKTAYRLREGVAPIPSLCLVALEHDDFGNETLEGTIRYWPVMLGGATPSLLLGPIAVAPRWQGGGLGSKLIRMTLNKAAAAGHRSVILVGDAPYYARFGFTRQATLGLQLPGPVDLDRFLGLELVPGALEGVTGMVGRAVDGLGLGTAGGAPARHDELTAPAPALPARAAAGGVWHARRA